MKKLSIFSSLILISFYFFSCKKNIVIEKTAEKTNFKSEVKKKQRWAEIIEDGTGQNYHCPEGKGECSRKAAFPDGFTELSLLNSYIANNNGGDYFTNENYQIYFSEIDEVAGLKEAIEKGEVFIYKVNTIDNNIKAMYVLSSSPTKQGIQNNNMILQWQFN